MRKRNFIIYIKIVLSRDNQTKIYLTVESKQQKQIKSGKQKSHLEIPKKDLTVESKQQKQIKSGEWNL